MNAIFTVGHGGWEVEELLDVLGVYRVDALADVRTRPVSRHPREFSADPLRLLLHRRAIRYVYLGDQLGGRPPDPDCYDAEGRVVYARCRGKDFFLRGIDRLLAGMRRGYTICLFCSEGDPSRCHRSRLIGEELRARGVDVRHILRGGEILGQEEVMRRVSGGQPLLFGDDRATSRGRYGPRRT